MGWKNKINVSLKLKTIQKKKGGVNVDIVMKHIMPPLHRHIAVGVIIMKSLFLNVHRKPNKKDESSLV